MDFEPNDLRASMMGTSSISRPINQPKNMAMRAMEFARSIGGLFRDGLMFQGNRDVYQVYGYGHRITYQQCRAKYRRQDIARRIVDMPADAIWTYPPTFQGDAQTLAVISDLTSRLSLWQTLNRADKLAAMDDYSTILVGVDDGQDLSQPVNSLRKNTITFLQPYSARSLHIQEYEANVSNPRFGKPLFYSLNMTNIRTEVPDGISSIFAADAHNISRVHYSRVIHVADGLLEDEIFGNPRLVNVFNLLDDLLKIGGGSAEIYWLNARGGLHIDVDKEMDLQADDADDLADEVDDYVNQQRRVMRTRGVKITPINMAMADPRQPFNVNISLISAATGIPQRLMLGSEAGQLASEQDRANWSTTIKQRRANFAEPRVIRPLLIVLAGLGLIDLKKALNTITMWPEAFQLSPLERGQTSAQQARSAANLVKAITPQPGSPAVPPTPATPATKTSVAVPANPGQPEKPDVPALLSWDEARGIIFLGYDTQPGRSAPEDDNSLT